MKDSEFIELLNLYLDHEIGSADAARLETEVQQNPERRRLYRQYCAMQKACTELAVQYVDVEVPAPKIASFSPRRQAWYPAALAAAACLTVFLFIRSREATPSAAPVSQPVAVSGPAKPAEAPLTPTFRLTSAQQAAYASSNTSFDWIKNTSLSSLEDVKSPALKLISPARAPAQAAASVQPQMPSFQDEKIDSIAFQLQRSN